jgi:hypothetical protein
MSFLRFSHHLNTKQPEDKVETMLEKIVSGGQTGVDRAALDVSIKLDIPHGGWCPKGRKAEDGVLSMDYQLTETASDDYSVRTKHNIRDSDGTLIIVPSTPIKVTDGTILTITEVTEKKKPYLIIDLTKLEDVHSKIINWMKENNIKILNVAGPRESQVKGIYETTYKLLTTTLSLIETAKNTVIGKLK